MIKVSFLIEREKEVQKYSEKGYIDIRSLENDYGFSKEELESRGFLQRKIQLIHPSICNYKLTYKGKCYFKYYHRYKLILLKPNHLEKLKESISNGSRHGSGHCDVWDDILGGMLIFFVTVSLLSYFLLNSRL